MKKIDIKKMGKISAGTNGALCFAAGLGIFTIGGPLTIVGVASLVYARDCWYS